MRKYITEGNILIGPDLNFEPTAGGLGKEIFNVLNSNKGKSAQHHLETGETLTYDELLIRSVRTAIYLSKKNLQKDDVVCLCSMNNIHTLVSFIACKFANVQYAAMEPTLPSDDMIYIMNLLKPKVLFVAENFIPRIEETIDILNHQCELISLGRGSTKYKSIYQLFSPVDGEQDFSAPYVEDIKDTAIIALSSGSTGKPKGVLLSHYSILLSLYIMSKELHRKGTVRFSNFTEEFTIGNNSVIIYSPPYWLSGFIFSMMTIFCGGCVFVGNVFDAERAWKVFQKFQPDTIFLPPGQVNELCAYGSSESPIMSVSFFGTGGGCVTSTHLEQMKKCFPNTRVTQLYGQTEHSGLATVVSSNIEEEFEYGEKNLKSCGRPVDGTKLRVVDIDTEKNCGPRECGELRIKSKLLMKGYFKMDSSSVFDSEGWFKTGDLVYFDENGFVYVVERIKDLILYTVYNIAPSIIENILKEHPAIFECCVLGIPHLKDNEHPMAVVVLKKGHQEGITEREIVSYVNNRVSDDRYKIRGGVKFVNEMLRNPTGKLKKLDMKRKISEGIPF
ncbi:luciferin 4-monooxygenase-like [Harmonia axyridis]|uniref:luciferin 4-monooxygenase-like n=1 Tax=Harmonia axyridis TaxID=115357 RepID=UPI001E2799A6|nr:luciferin 4-monooxygenase-like [Harmonia axyridis]